MVAHRQSMTDTTPRPKPYTDRLRKTLAETGHAPAMAEAMIALDATNFQFVRRVQKGEIPASLIDKIGAGIELAQFQALSAILRIEAGYGRPGPQEVTVGLLAEELMVDPSRASRIAADLVDRALVARSVSQQDGRRSVLIPTPEGRALLDRFLQAKWQAMMRVFRDWPTEDVQMFARLFARYCDGMGREFAGGRE